MDHKGLQTSRSALWAHWTPSVTIHLWVEEGVKCFYFNWGASFWITSKLTPPLPWLAKLGLKENRKGGLESTHSVPTSQTKKREKLGRLSQYPSLIITTREHTPHCVQAQPDLRLQRGVFCTTLIVKESENLSTRRLSSTLLRKKKENCEIKFMWNRKDDLKIFSQKPLLAYTQHMSHTYNTHMQCF